MSEGRGAGGDPPTRNPPTVGGRRQSPMTPAPGSRRVPSLRRLALPAPGGFATGITAVSLAVKAVTAEVEPAPALLALDRPDWDHAGPVAERGSGRTRRALR